MSYRKKHIKNKIGNSRSKKSVFKKIWLWLVILLVVFVLTILYFLLFFPKFQINNIVIKGAQKINAQDLKEFILTNINSKSIFLFNKTKLLELAKDKYSGIENIKIIKIFPQTLQIDISERRPIGVYCSGDNCYLIDEKGVVFDGALVDKINMTIVRQFLENIEIKEGSKVLEENVANSIYKIQKNLKDNFQIELKEALITSPIRLNGLTSENWKLYFDLEEGSNIDDQLEKLYFLFKNGEISPSSRKNLRYIDLRPKDRAIICDNSVCGN